MRSNSSAIAGSTLYCIDVLPPPSKPSVLVPLNTRCPRYLSEIDHGEFSNSVPRTVCFVSECTVPFFFSEASGNLAAYAATLEEFF